MIQLPSKIRTTLFNATVEIDPYQLFAHEDDRILAMIYQSFSETSFAAFGRSKQDVLNSDTTEFIYYFPMMIYGPEPLWMGVPKRIVSASPAIVLVHGIYRA